MELPGPALLLVTLLMFSVTAAVTISDATDEGRDCFKIVTSGATYYYDKKGGGFTSLLDKDGNDWINFHMDPASGTAAAAGKYRGIPNTVYNQDATYDGAGHPGHDKCTSVKTSATTINTKAGTVWEWNWEFFDTYAVQTMVKVQTGKKYWFLYEGTPGGDYKANNLAEDFWSHNLASSALTPSTSKVTGKWQWVYFGDTGMNRVLFIKQHTTDGETDQFYCMNANQDNDGMFVFGFGRTSATPLMTAANSYTMGFIESKDHATVKNAIENGGTVSSPVTAEDVQQEIGEHKTGSASESTVQGTIDDYAQEKDR